MKKEPREEHYPNMCCKRMLSMMKWGGSYVFVDRFLWISTIMCVTTWMNTQSQCMSVEHVGKDIRPT